MSDIPSGVCGNQQKLKARFGQSTDDDDDDKMNDRA